MSKDGTSCFSLLCLNNNNKKEKGKHTLCNKSLS